MPNIVSPGNADVLPPEPTPSDVITALALALAKMFPADQLNLGAAQARLEGKYAEGFRAGKTLGFRDGYGAGYAEGMEEGRREALDQLAREEAERATIKAAARARREP